MSSTGDLAYFTIPVANLERGKDFYGGLFGWKFEAEHSHEKYAHIGNTTPAGGLNVADGASARVWFKVGNIRTSVARVRELGGQADEPLQSASGWSCACRDDQGTQFDLWEPGARVLMAHPHKSYDPHGPIGRLRELCLALEEATEKEAWGESTFRIGGKMFAMTDNNHHGDGRIAVWCNAPLGFQSMMVGMAPERYFAPPYVGHKGWIGVRLDGDVDWDELATIVEQAYRMSGPRLPPARKSLSGKISVAPAKKPARHRSRARFPIGRAPKGKRTR